MFISLAYKKMAKKFGNENHVNGYNALPQYEIRGYKVYRTPTPEDGPSELPDLIIRYYIRWVNLAESEKSMLLSFVKRE